MTPRHHLDARLLDKLLSGKIVTISPEEARNLAWHLVELCPECGHAAESEWALAGIDEDQSLADVMRLERGGARDLQGVFERVQRRVEATMSEIERASERAPDLVDELLRQTPPRRSLLALNDSRYQSLPVAEVLLERAWRIGLETPLEAETLSRLVLDLVDRIQVDGLSESILNDVRARAWGVCGNFRRIVADYRGANEAFQCAWQFLEEGSGDLLERARLLTLESTLCRYQKRRDKAGEMIEEAIRIYKRLGEEHLVGRTLVHQGLLFSEQGEASRAIEVLREAQGFIDPIREPRMIRVAQQNLMVYLSECGRYEEAMAMIPSLRHKLVADGTRADLLRLRWSEGRIHLGLGNDTRAEAALLEVRRGMLDLDLPKDVAVVTLELAALYMRQRRTAEIRDLAAQMFPIFQSRDLHQEAIAALLLFQRAVEMDTLTLRMVEEVADVVRRSQDRPRPQTPEPS